MTDLEEKITKDENNTPDCNDESIYWEKRGGLCSKFMRKLVDSFETNEEGS